jgi:hypothetical protein
MTEDMHYKEERACKVMKGRTNEVEEYDHSFSY